MQIWEMYKKAQASIWTAEEIVSFRDKLARDAHLLG